jgi:hypothetical protein
MTVMGLEIFGKIMVKIIKKNNKILKNLGEKKIIYI